MRSEKGLGLLQLMLIVIALMFLVAVSVYVLIGENGVLNREEVKPISSTNEINEVE